MQNARLGARPLRHHPELSILTDRLVGLKPVDDLVERFAGGLGQHKRAKRGRDETRARKHGPHGPNAERCHQQRVHFDGGEHQFVTTRVQHAVHGALDGHRKHLAAHAPRQRQHGKHGEEHVHQERHEQQIAGWWVSHVTVHVLIGDDSGQGSAHACARDQGQRALGHRLEHETDHGADQPGGAQVHGGRHATDGHAAVA